MAGKKNLEDSIPISVALKPTLEASNIQQPKTHQKKRIVFISGLAILVGIAISFISRLLVKLIYLITHLAFYGEVGFDYISPAGNHLGLWVIAIPVIGGIIAGLMALFGSKAIRGHGIPEAMEQILTNQSKIKPTITYLKPISSAIVMGTGGPFGAEGPIIATGGALGSTLGQLLNITHNERKILLASGATAGMAAIFGSPIAAIFLAIELLLFEFSPRAIIPVALACITGGAGHHFLFDGGPAFPMQGVIEAPGNTALVIYSILGLCIGLLSVFVTKIVYWLEDLFEKLPVHWMWWPAIGGIVVGVVGYFSPQTLGVGYENIIDVLSGSLPLKVVLSLCLLKFVSWSVALASGTSGGTLAPMMTIGSAAGVLMASVILHFFPHTDITLPLAALVCMSALFAGASRALLTSIVFALEATGQINALLPLLAACTGSYIVSFLLMKNTIMTEKITRRGIKTPDSYEPDVLNTVYVKDVLNENGMAIREDNTISEVRNWLDHEEHYKTNYFIIVDDKSEYRGIISSSNLYNHHHDDNMEVGNLIKRNNISINSNNSLKEAVELMAKENIDLLPVVAKDNQISGVLSYKDIISAYKKELDKDIKKKPVISLKRNGMKILVRGQRLISTFKK